MVRRRGGTLRDRDAHAGPYEYCSFKLPSLPSVTCSSEVPYMFVCCRCCFASAGGDALAEGGQAAYADRFREWRLSATTFLAWMEAAVGMSRVISAEEHVSSPGSSGSPVPRPSGAKEPCSRGARGAQRSRAPQ